MEEQKRLLGPLSSFHKTCHDFPPLGVTVCVTNTRVVEGERNEQVSTVFHLLQPWAKRSVNQAPSMTSCLRIVSTQRRVPALNPDQQVGVTLSYFCFFFYSFLLLVWLVWTSWADVFCPSSLNKSVFYWTWYLLSSWQASFTNQSVLWMCSRLMSWWYFLI